MYALAIGASDGGKIAAQAEAAGFAGVWTSEMFHDPFLPLASAAAQTSTIELGTSIALAFVRSLKRAGIEVQVRSVDATQYERRLIGFDFDMTQYRWEQSLSPGNEQLFYFGSAAASEDGSRNYMGVKSKAADAMIAAMLSATSRDDFVAATRALDRVLLSGFYVVPLYFPPKQWIARWTRIKHPSQTSLFGYLPETWWHGGGP